MDTIFRISMNLILHIICVSLFIVLHFNVCNAADIIANNSLSDDSILKAILNADVSGRSSPRPTAILLSGKSAANSDCNNVNLTERRGTISSPNYPNAYHERTSCMWYISGTQLNDIITISFDDLDLEVPHDLRELCSDKRNDKSSERDTELCCAYGWVKIGSNDGNEHKYCGYSEDNSLTLKPFISTTNQLWIKFHSEIKVKGGRGFHLSYIVSSSTTKSCKSDEFRCANGKCILNVWRCNRKNECGDGSDELQCDDICLGNNEVKCWTASHTHGLGCYSFPSQRCNAVWDCENGADERGCGGCPQNMYMCRTGMSCFSESKRCDGVIDCVDFTDELNCGFCGKNKTQCGSSFTHCYDPFTQRCNRYLDCPNGDDEIGCIRGCYNKILCASGSGCYSPEERCNGVPECNDYSDEKNCTLDLCRPERGSFLCGNGRCIRSIWTCDRSNDCADGTDEMHCLKNSVITAAIMGSLICGLLFVIAISCTCKLIALRRMERNHCSSSPSHISHHYDQHLSVSGITGDSDSPLFRPENGFFFREPPPSYASIFGGYPQSDRNNSYIEQIRQIRRQRRLRRMRRRPPSPPSIEFAQEEDIPNANTTHNLNYINNNGMSTTSTNISDTQSESDKNERIKEEVNASATHSQQSNTTASSDTRIELSDSQPLIS